MKAADWLCLYWNFNIVLMALAFLFFVVKSSRFLSQRISARSFLKSFYASLLFAPVAVVLARWMTPSFEPVIKVWSDAASSESKRLAASSLSSSLISIEGFQPHPFPVSDLSLMILLGAAFTILMVGLIRFQKALHALDQVSCESFLLRRIGRVRILVHSACTIPFSFFQWGRAVVVIPEIFLAQPAEFKVAVLHELQHHRQKDTLWTQVLFVLKCFCFWNPAIYLIDTQLQELQEFACDESLLGRKKISSQVYIRCLLETAQSAIRQKQPLACAAGLSFLTKRHLLKRRILTMITHQKRPSSKVWAIILSIICSAVTFSAATMSATSIQDRRVSREEAEKMADNLKGKTQLQLPINDEVLAELNYFLGTPKGRAFFEESLERMQTYKDLVDRKLAEAGVPAEFRVVPLIESGYQNLRQNSRRRDHGAGLWMFLKTTATNKRFGLRVDDKVDERLDIEKETNAAMKYFVTSKDLHQSWELALLAYNIGDGHLLKARKELQTDDPWKIIRAGYSNDPRYLPMIIAATLIAYNPSSLH